MTAANRAKLISAIHAAKSKAGLDDDAYRAMLSVHGGGKASSKDCTEAELRAVLSHLNGASGARPFKPSKRPEVRKIHAQWGELKRLGALDSPTKPALRAFCARMANTGDATTDPEFLTPEHARVVIEALKAMIKRAEEK